MSTFLFLLFAAIILFALLLFRFKPKTEKLVQMAGMGLFLTVFDFVYQTTAFYLGFWQSNNSIFLLGPAVPLEVAFIAFFTGASLNLLFPKFSFLPAVAAAFLVALAGATIEAFLLRDASIVYGNGWTSLHTFVGYWLVFIFLQFINTKIFAQFNARRKGYIFIRL